MPAPSLSELGHQKARAFGYGCALDDRPFRLAVGPGRRISIETAELEPPRVNTASSPEELAETDPTFARSQFSGGEGLFRAHVEGAAADRFWDSKNISAVPAEPGDFPEVTLLHSTSSIETSATSGLFSAYDKAGGSLYMCEGTVLRRTDDPTATTPTFSDDDPHDGEAATTVEDVAVLGNEVYAALGANGIHQKTSGAWSHWGTNPAGEEYVRVWAVKGRIVASTGASLYEVTASGPAPSALKVLASGDTWTSVTDGGSHILAASSDGYVYAFTTSSGSMALDGQTLFEGESVEAVGQTQGVVAVGTSAANVGRMYVGVLADNGQVTELRLIKQWGDSGTATDQTPHRIIGTRDTLVTAVPDGTDTYCWRYDLATDGFTRYLTVAGSSGLARGLEVIEGRLFVSVDGAGKFREDSTFSSSGYLISPLADFFSSDDKSWVGARLETGDLSAGMAVELFYTTDPDALTDPDHSSWQRVTRRSSGTGDPGEHSLSNVVSRSLAGMVKLEPSTDATASPAVRSFSFRAYPSSGNEDVIVTLPVNVSDQIERRGMSRRRVKGRGEAEWVALQGFEGRPVVLELFKPDMTVRGLVEQVSTPVPSLSTRGSALVVSQVRIKGQKVGSTGFTSGTGAFGTYHLFGTAPSFGEIA